MSRSTSTWEYLGSLHEEGSTYLTVAFFPADDVGNSGTRLFLLRQQTFYNVRLITFAAALFFFYHQFVEFNYHDVVMEALLGIDHLSLRACLGRRFARPVKETHFNLDNCGRL